MKVDDNVMQARMLLTPTTNINQQRIVDESKVESRTMNWTDAIDVRIKDSESKRTINVKELSLYDHVLLLDDDDFCLISMVSSTNHGTCSTSRYPGGG